MGFITVDKENSTNIDLYYEDLGSGQPVVLIHGYPLDGHSWEKQTKSLLDAGYRVIAYDRRGWGQSSQPTTGHDYDTYAADLNELLEQLEIEDIVLAGFSMGTGEVTRYLGTHGSDRVRKAVLFGAIPPFLLKTDDNPDGVDGSVFEGIKEIVLKDRYVWFKQFFDDFYNVDKLAPERISEQAWQASFNVACMGSAYSSYACVDAWLTDFRDDLPKIDIPTLVMHGTEDRILPFDSTAGRLSDLIDDVTVIPVENGPHNIGWTHPEVVNPILLAFLEGGLDGVDQARSKVASA
jgi:non-heme chloroperoxidase